MEHTTLISVNKRINIPVTQDTRSQMELIAEQRGVSLAEIGREALEAFVRNEKCRLRTITLKENAIKFADIINSVGKEWSVTETDGLLDD